MESFSQTVNSTQTEDQAQKLAQGKRKFWLPSEDSQLIELINMHGEKWSKIASLMQGRTGKQIRDRYINSLKPGIRQEAWTAAEDELLVKLYRKIGNKWSKIAHCLKGRTENQVKNRFRTCFKRKFKRLSSKETANLDKESLKNSLDEDDVNLKVLEMSDDDEADTSTDLKEESQNNNAQGLATSHPLQLKIEGFNQFSAPRKVFHAEESKYQKERQGSDSYSPLMSLRNHSQTGIHSYIMSSSNYSHLSSPLSGLSKGFHSVGHLDRSGLQSSCDYQVKFNEEDGSSYVKEEYSNFDTDSSLIKEEYINVKYE